MFDAADRGQIRDLGLLASVVRAFLNPLELEPLAESVRSFGAWEALIAQAEAHRVYPVLWKVLNSLPAGSVPAVVLSRLRADYDANALHSLRTAGDLRRLYDLFERNEIQALPFKGPVLAIAAYNDLSMRSFSDLDLLFRKEDVLRARDLLTKEGFEMTTNLHWDCESAGLRHVISEFSMTRGHLSVDLHWRLIPDYYPYKVDSPAVWDEQDIANIAGRSMRCLSPEHQLLYLAAHGTKHLWQCLGWICDFAQYLNTGPIDWQRVADLADSDSTSLMLAHALTVAQDFAGVTLPLGARILMDSCPSLARVSARLAPSIAHRVRSQDAPKPSYSEDFRYMREFSTRRFAMPGLWFSTLFAPREADWQALRLPPSAYPLYYPFRFFRLATKYAVGRKKR